MLTPDEAREVFQLIRGVFSMQKFSPKEEGKILDLVRTASTKDVALDAVDRIWRDGDRWFNPLAYRMALTVEYQRLPTQEPIPAGPFMTLQEWYATQGPEMQARVRRVFPSMRVEL